MEMKTIESILADLRQESSYPFVVVGKRGDVWGTDASVGSLLSGGGKVYIFRGSDIRQGVGINSIMPGEDDYFNNTQELAEDIVSWAR